MLNVRGRKSTEQVSGCHGISSASASPALEPEYRIGNSGADAAEVATECVLGRVDRRLLAPLFRQVYQRIRNAVLPPLGRKSRGMKILDAHQLGNRLLNVADARFR